VEDEDNGLGDNRAFPSPGRDPDVLTFNGLINCTRCALAILAMDSALLIELIGRPSLYVSVSSPFSASSASLKGFEPDFISVELEPRDFTEGAALEEGEEGEEPS